MWRIVNKSHEAINYVFTLANDNNENIVLDESSLVQRLRDGFPVINGKITSDDKIAITQQSVISRKQKLEQAGFTFSYNDSLEDIIHNIVLELYTQYELGITDTRPDKTFYNIFHKIYPDMSKNLAFVDNLYALATKDCFDAKTQTFKYFGYYGVEDLQKHPEFAKIVNPITLVTLLKSFDAYYKYNDILIDKCNNYNLRYTYMCRPVRIKLEKSRQERKYWWFYQNRNAVLDATEIDDEDIIHSLINCTCMFNMTRHFDKLIFKENLAHIIYEVYDTNTEVMERVLFE